MFRFNLQNWLGVVILLVAALASCTTEPVPRVTPTVRPTDTPTQGTPIAQIPTRTPIITVTDTAAPSATATATSTPTQTPTDTPIPSDTPTPTETNTPNPSETPTLTFTPTDTPTATPTPTASPTPSDTPTATPTDTPPATDTFTPTRTARPSPLPEPDDPTPTDTLTSTPTETPSTTPTPSDTPTPLPKATATASQTATATRTATRTATPSVTPTVTVDLTEIARQVFATQTAFASTRTARAASPTPNPIRLSETAVAMVMRTPLYTPTPAVTTPPPTQDVTPTFITATPGATVTFPPEDQGIITPDPADAEERFGPTATPRPTATVIYPTVAPVNAPPTLQRNWREQIVQRNITNLEPQDFTIGENVDLSGGTLGSLGAEGGLPQLFARNPVDPDQYVETNNNGALFVNTGSGERIPNEPFSPYVGQVSTPQENDYFVSAVAWSPDGRYVAFIVDGDRGGHPNPTGEDGVHLLDTQTGTVRALLRDCPYEDHPGCDLGGSREVYAQSTELHWSPDSSQLVVRARITNDWAEGQDQGIIYVLPPSQNPEQQPRSLRFDYATWTLDGRRLVVSGDSPQTGMIIGTVNPDGSNLRVALRGQNVPGGLAIQHAVQRRDGSFLALGRTPGMEAVRMINGNGQFITPPIGSAPPQSVTWNGDRTAVEVIAGGQGYIAYADGRVESAAPGTEVPGGAAPDALPPGVVEGERFDAGQQVQVAWELLNFRAEPGVAEDNPPIGSLERGEYVRVLAGPVQRDGFEWWQVQRNTGRRGWVAAVVNGSQTLLEGR